jgi:hypothetical protein
MALALVDVCCLLLRKEFRFGDVVEAVQGGPLDGGVQAAAERGVPTDLGRTVAQATDRAVPSAAVCRDPRMLPTPSQIAPLLPRLDLFQLLTRFSR